MATRNAGEIAGMSRENATPKTRGIAKNIHSTTVVIPATLYFMAAFDDLGNRYTWTTYVASFTGAPTPSGSYESASLVIEGRIVRPNTDQT